MASKTRMLEWVRRFCWREVQAGLVDSPKLVDFRDQKGRSWLHICCSVNPKARDLAAADSVKTARVLLDAGLDLDREAFREGDWKATPLWYAVARGENPLLAKELLKRGADPNYCLWAAAFRDDVAMIKLLAAGGAEIDPVTEDETPFLSAIKTSHFRAAKLLLELGANVDFQDKRGMTALHYMLKKGSDERHVRTVVRQGARGDIANRDGVTAAEILGRKRSASFRKLANELAAR